MIGSVDDFGGRRPDYVGESGDGNLVIYLPDGHIADGGFKEIWDATGMPWPEGRDYIVRLNELELRRLGYPKDGVEEVTIALLRPHDIPESIRDYGGIGVSGRDLYVDKLGMDMSSCNGGFVEGLNRQGMIRLIDLGCRPSYLAAAFPKRYGIANMGEVKGVLARLKPNVAVVATEFGDIATTVAEESMGFQSGEYTIRKANGKTEVFPRLGQSHGIVDVTETGNSLRENELAVAEPFIMERITPQFVSNASTYRAHAPVVDEMVKRMEARIDELMEDNPQIFKDKLQTEGLFASV